MRYPRLPAKIYKKDWMLHAAETMNEIVRFKHTLTMIFS